jgi:uncharacterized OB-fold protein
MTLMERQRFWELWANGVLLLHSCASCATRWIYASPVCPICASSDLGSQPAEGSGRVYSYTVVPGRDGAEDRVIVLVELAEGARVMGNLIGSSVPSIGLGVRVSTQGVARGPITFVQKSTAA